MVHLSNLSNNLKHHYTDVCFLILSQFMTDKSNETSKIVQVAELTLPAC